jgi:hypothetical protein
MNKIIKKGDYIAREIYGAYGLWPLEHWNRKFESVCI